MLKVEITGTAIYSDMLAKKVKKEYDSLLGAGIDFDEAEKLIIDAFCSGSFSPEHESVFWLGLACAEHRYGALSGTVRDRAVKAIKSGEDIKKWDNAAAYEPYYKYISSNDADKHALKILSEIAMKKYSEKPLDCTEEKFLEFQRELIARLIKDCPKYKKLMPKNSVRKNTAPVKDPQIKPDEFFEQLHKLGGGCAENAKKRRLVLKETEEYLTAPAAAVKPKKFSLVKCPWTSGDIVAVKSHSAERTPYCSYQNGKYILLLILKVIKEPVSELIPAETAAKESVIAGFYDYYGDNIPDENEIGLIPFMKTSGPFGTIHTGHRIYLEGCTRFFKKTLWKTVGHYEGFPETIPQFIKEGIMGSSIMSFNCDIFNFVPVHRKR